MKSCSDPTVDHKLCFCCSVSVSSVCRERRRFCTTTAGQNHSSTAARSHCADCVLFCTADVHMLFILYCLQDKNWWDQPKEGGGAEGHEPPHPETTDRPHGSQSGLRSVTHSHTMHTTSLHYKILQVETDNFSNQCCSCYSRCRKDNRSLCLSQRNNDQRHKTEREFIYSLSL